MFRNHVSSNLTRSGGFVNLTVSLGVLAMVAVGYFSAIGRLAGVA